MRKLYFLAVLIVTGLLVVAIWQPSAVPWLSAYLPEGLKAVAATNPAGETPVAGSRRGGGATTVQVAVAEQRSLPMIERTYGLVKSPAVAQVNSRIASQVTAIHVKDGQQVKPGDLLLTLDDRTLRAQYAQNKAQLAKDEATEIGLAAELARAKSLLARRAGTQATLDQAVASHNAALATLEADKAAIAADEVQISYTKITAPIAGKLGSINVVIGDNVSANATTSLMTITTIAPLKIETRLPERLLSRLRHEPDKKVLLRAYAAGTRDLLDEGPVDFLDSAVDAASGTIGISATVQNSNGRLWPGQHVDIEIQLGELPGMPVVPTVAIQQGQAGPFVWLVKDGKTVEPRQVKVARDEQGLTAISEGLAAGDAVVVEGQLRLAPGANVRVTGPEGSQENTQAANP